MYSIQLTKSVMVNTQKIAKLQLAPTSVVQVMAAHSQNVKSVTKNTEAETLVSFWYYANMNFVTITTPIQLWMFLNQVCALSWFFFQANIYFELFPICFQKGALSVVETCSGKVNNMTDDQKNGVAMSKRHQFMVNVLNMHKAIGQSQYTLNIHIPKCQGLFSNWTWYKFEFLLHIAVATAGAFSTIRTCVDSTDMDPPSPPLPIGKNVPITEEEEIMVEKHKEEKRKREEAKVWSSVALFF